MGATVNASKSTLLRGLRALGYSACLLAVFQACSGDDTSTPLTPAGPASVEITGISLGNGLVGDGGESSVLACDYKIGVTVQTTNWTLYPPGRCGSTPQCGQLRVTLTSASGNVLASSIAAGNGVALDVRTLLPGAAPIEAGRYTIQVELVDDAGKVHVALDGGNGSAETEFSLTLPADCANPPDMPGAGGAGGSGGASNAGASGDGAGGTAGDGAAGDGAAGDGAAGVAGALSSAGATAG